MNVKFKEVCKEEEAPFIAGHIYQFIRGVERDCLRFCCKEFSGKLALVSLKNGQHKSRCADPGMRAEYVDVTAHYKLTPA